MIKYVVVPIVLGGNKMSYWMTDEGKKHFNEKKDEIEDSLERRKTKAPIEKQIECPNCKTLNEPHSVVCISCGENIAASRQKQPRDFSVIRSAEKRRKH